MATQKNDARSFKVADDHRGLRNLGEVLVNDYGLDLDGWILQDARGISDDGNVIVGWGTNPQGQIEAWRFDASARRHDGRGCGVGVGLPGLAVFWCACLAWLVALKVRKRRISSPLCKHRETEP